AGNSLGALISGDFLAVLRNISPIIILAIIYFAHKVVRKTKIIKLEEMDLKSHKYE
ncbi:gamma-aminobutyrate permease, partial [Enterobacter mori]